MKCEWSEIDTGTRIEYETDHALEIAGRANPELLNEYADLEIEIGHSFKHNQPIAAVRDRILNGGT